MADDAQTLEPVPLPDHLVLLILSKLPLKSLKRFACVCKLWAFLFQNPHFMKIFLNNFVSNWSLSHNNQDTSLLVSHIALGTIGEGGFRSSLFSLSHESIHNLVKLEWPNPFQEDVPNFCVIGSTSINGILCLYRRNALNPIVLWNPTTQESKVVPLSPVDSVPLYQHCGFMLIGFGYDRVRDDYKVIRYVCFFSIIDNDILPGLPGPPVQEPVWEIYSLRSNSWSILDCDDDSVLPAGIDYRDLRACTEYSDRIYLDGMCHWIGGHVKTTRYFFENHLVSFDLSNEVFYKTSMPLDMPMPSNKGFVRHLLLLNESIAVITNPIDTTDIYISILGQVGVKESWTRLFILESLPCIIRPLGIGKKGNIFFVKDTDDSELVQFDLSTYMIEDLGVKGAKHWSEIVLYKT